MSILEELKAIISRPIFVLIVLGYAANTGMMIGVSTFGSALLLEFGYVPSPLPRITHTLRYTLYDMMMSCQNWVHPVTEAVTFTLT